LGPDCGATTGAGGLAGRCAGVPYLAMLLERAASLAGGGARCEVLAPGMLWGEPKEGVLPEGGLVGGAW
jgi:hypothetical protein